MGAAFVYAATVLISFHVWRNLSPTAWPDPTCRHRTWLSRSRASKRPTHRNGGTGLIRRRGSRAAGGRAAPGRTRR